MNQTFKIGKFTVTRAGNTVTIKPGFMKLQSTAGQWIYNKECTVSTIDSGAAQFEFKRFCKIAVQEYTVNLWDRLNHAPHSLYMRFQKFVARKHSGKWIRGININQGNVSFNFE